MSPCTPDEEATRREIIRLMDEEREREARAAILAKREQDWHDVSVMGVKAAIGFVFFVPIMALGCELACRLVLHPTQSTPIIEGLGNLLWICAGGMTALLAAAYKFKNAKVEDVPPPATILLPPKFDTTSDGIKPDANR